MNRLLRTLALYLLVLAPLTIAAMAEGLPPLKPDRTERCPVCGMFVAKHPAWVCHVVFKDGAGPYFDGPKDLSAYYLDLGRYASGKARGDIEAVVVTDYYTLAPVSAMEAFFVMGSDVSGPMGQELIPFAREESAREFMKDHKGKRLLRFQDITPAIVKALG